MLSQNSLFANDIYFTLFVYYRSFCVCFFPATICFGITTVLRSSAACICKMWTRWRRRQLNEADNSSTDDDDDDDCIGTCALAIRDDMTSGEEMRVFFSLVRLFAHLFHSFFVRSLLCRVLRAHTTFEYMRVNQNGNKFKKTTQKKKKNK